MPFFYKKCDMPVCKNVAFVYKTVTSVCKNVESPCKPMTLVYKNVASICENLTSPCQHATSLC